MWMGRHRALSGIPAKPAAVLSLVLMFLAVGQMAVAQAPAPTEQSGIQEVLAAYEKCYDRGDYESITKLWPNLNGDKKEAKKLKERLSRPDISETQLHFEVLSTQPAANGVVAHVKRHEQYLQREYSSYSSADNMIGTMPAQNPGPSKQASTRKVSKTGDTWIRLQQGTQGWTIVEMSEKKPAGVN